MTPVYERVAVIGLGLLGGSVARAARARGVARVVVGATRRRSALDRALAEGAVDAVASREDAVRDAELVVLATPVSAMADTIRAVAPGLAPGATVTDVGSVKAVLHETLPGLLPPGVRYIGSHPMAGSHERGFEQSREDLFDGAPCVVSDSEESPERARLCAFWKALGARVFVRDAVDHDAEAAWVSHLPHVLAYAFAEALERAPGDARDLAGSGFRDFTRIALSEPEMWGEILTENRKALAAPLQVAAEVLSGFARAVEANDADELERRINAARETLSRFSSSNRTRQEAPGESHPAAEKR
jgi:cyclohexadieny/prephenate dehydrogenase